MNKNTYIKYKKELDAWADGKEVEYRFKGKNLWLLMRDHTPSRLNCDIELRMKPEPPKLEYRPFSESDSLIKLLDSMD